MQERDPGGAMLESALGQQRSFKRSIPAALTKTSLASRGIFKG